MTNSETSRLVSKNVEVVLKPLGYKQRLNKVFYREDDDAMLLIELQTHKAATSGTVEITANLGVSSIPLLELLEYGNRRLDIGYSHWRVRIGELMPIARDYWWAIDSKEQAAEASKEIAGSLVQYGLPALANVCSTAKLLTLWQNDSCPGLTDFQRKEYIALLTKRSSP